MARVGAAARPYLPPVNFITVHHAYFIIVGLLFAVIFWTLSYPDKSVSFVDSLFLVESAFTSSGLNTVNLSQLTTGQQVIIALMMILGSPVLISLFTIGFRAHIFEKRFEDIVERERSRRKAAQNSTSLIVGMTGAMFGAPVMSTFRKAKRAPRRAATWVHTKQAEADAFQLASPIAREPATSVDGHRPITSLEPIREAQKLELEPEPQSLTSDRPQSGWTQASRFAGTRRAHSQDDERPTTSDGFDFRAFVRENKNSIGRNGQFFDLTEEQREYLGGVEYRALKILFVIVSIYFVVWQVLGAITLGAWMSIHASAITAVNDQNPWWAGIFLGISSFNNAGMTLLDAGIAAFDNDAFVLTIVTLLALGGNYAFPAFIRATVFTCNFLLKHGTDEGEYLPYKEAFDFILKYPRRIYMMMFPAKANWTFVAICSSLGAVNWVMLLVLGMGNTVLEIYPVGQRIGLALFQSLTIPSGGYTVISVSSLYFDTLVLWVAMMYVAAYPEIIVMRNSNVYEERSLGIYTSTDDKTHDTESVEKTSLDELLPGPGTGLDTVQSVSGVSYANTRYSTKSIKKLSAVGRRGTAFVGRQIQRRINNFQGVGVTPQPRLQRAQEIDFSKDAQPAVVEEGHVSLVTQHLRSQLSHDIWSIALALFLITLIETTHTIQDPTAYSVFNYLFEVVSGYTNIGLSIGLPEQSFSFSGGWYTGSKVIMILMMVRGRHRGLPVALDHAVKLPGWDNVKKQQEDAEIRRSINRSRASIDIT